VTAPGRSNASSSLVNEYLGIAPDTTTRFANFDRKKPLVRGGAALYNPTMVWVR
jgi:hypothetical protein